MPLEVAQAKKPRFKLKAPFYPIQTPSKFGNRVVLSSLGRACTSAPHRGELLPRRRGVVERGRLPRGGAREVQPVSSHVGGPHAGVEASVVLVPPRVHVQVAVHRQLLYIRSAMRPV